jgi:hypothetical protein
MDLNEATFVRIDAPDQVNAGDTVYPLVHNKPETKRPCTVLRVGPEGVLVINKPMGQLALKFKRFTRAFEPGNRDD